MKRLGIHTGLWSLILLIAFFALQLIPALYQPIHQLIFLKQQEALFKLDERNPSLESLKMTREMFSNLQEEEKEITWNGKRYDIKSIQYHDGIVELIIKHDSLETQLKSIVSIIQGQKSGDPSCVSHSAFFAFFHQTIGTYHLIQPHHTEECLLLSSFYPATHSMVIIAPPPRG